MAQTQTVFRLLQLVALALPAIAIYLQVLTSVFSEAEEIRGVNPTGVVVLTKADERWEFASAIFSLLFLIASTLPLILQLAFQDSGLLGSLLMSLALLLIIFAFLSFGVSVILTIHHSPKEIP